MPIHYFSYCIIISTLLLKHFDLDDSLRSDCDFFLGRTGINYLTQFKSITFEVTQHILNLKTTLFEKKRRSFWLLSVESVRSYLVI